MNKPQFFITGTDTSAGKTVVSAALIRYLQQGGKRVAGLKPIASGFEMHNGAMQNDDVDALKAVNNVELPLQVLNRYAFTPSIAPHIAARQVGEIIDFDLIKHDVEQALNKVDVLVVEGVGGWLVPLTHDLVPHKSIQTLAQHLQMPIVLVVGMKLGCLNHALLSASAIAASNVPFAGWVANYCDADFECAAENLATLEQLIPAPKLFEVLYRESAEDKVQIININPSWQVY